MACYMIVSLRPICSKDMPKMLEWRNKTEIRKWFFDSRILTLRDQEEWYSAYMKKDDDQMFIIQVDSVGVGTIAIYNIDRKKKKAEIGRILIGEDEYRSRGYAYQAGRLLLQYAFDSLEMERLYLMMFADNEAAQNLYAKLGFMSERILRDNILTPSGPKDVIVMGLLRKEFSSQG